MGRMRVQVLMVEDEDALAASTTEYLATFGVSAHHVPDAERAHAFLAEHEADLILLDINLPGASGYDFCRRVRAASDVPILFISARESDDDEILALTVGGDDYIRKPYSLSVLLAKVRRILQRSGATADGFDDGHLRWDPATDRIHVAGTEPRLTAMEHRLLVHLLTNRGRVVTKAELFEQVWQNAVTGDGTLTVHISRLRGHIEKDPERPRYIRTVWGRGYLFEAER